MNLEFTGTQKQLQAMARDFLKTRCALSAVRSTLDSESGFCQELWQAMGDLGWLNMIFPEEYGGTGASLLDLAVIYEEMGKALVPSPHLTSVILCGLTILEGGSHEQKVFFLPKIGSGQIISTLALDEPEYRWGTGLFVTVGEPCGSYYILLRGASNTSH